jgi:hypothetical protein
MPLNMDALRGSIFNGDACGRGILKAETTKTASPRNLKTTYDKVQVYRRLRVNSNYIYIYIYINVKPRVTCAKRKVDADNGRTEGLTFRAAMSSASKTMHRAAVGAGRIFHEWRGSRAGYPSDSLNFSRFGCPLGSHPGS